MKQVHDVEELRLKLTLMLSWRDLFPLGFLLFRQAAKNAATYDSLIMISRK
ncbi:hypothetical protein PATA110616_20845 [Paenibacillus tarimensis]